MLPSKASIAPRISLLFTDIRSPGFSKLFRNKSNDVRRQHRIDKSHFIVPDVQPDPEYIRYGFRMNPFKSKRI